MSSARSSCAATRYSVALFFQFHVSCSDTQRINHSRNHHSRRHAREDHPRGSFASSYISLLGRSRERIARRSRRSIIDFLRSVDSERTRSFDDYFQRQPKRFEGSRKPRSSCRRYDLIGTDNEDLFAAAFTVCRRSFFSRTTIATYLLINIVSGQEERAARGDLAAW